MSDLSKHGHRISFNGFEISASALTTTEVSWQLKAQFEMKWGEKRWMSYLLLITAIQLV